MIAYDPVFPQPDQDAGTFQPGLSNEQFLSALFLAALLANPARYEYIADCVRSEEVDQDEATLKNIRKAHKMAKQFMEEIP